MVVYVGYVAMYDFMWVLFKKKNEIKFDDTQKQNILLRYKFYHVFIVQQLVVFPYKRTAGIELISV